MPSHGNDRTGAMGWGAAGLIITVMAAIGTAPSHADGLVGQAVVDASYQRFTMELKNRRDRLLLWLKAEPQDGPPKVCGAYLAMMPENRFNGLPRWPGGQN